MLPDAVHPDKEGAAVLAKTVYEGITGDFGGLQMPEIYTDNMVLQHGRLLTIQGKADAGEKVTVSIDRQQLQAVTGADGKWAVDVRPLKAGGPYTLTVSTEKRKLVYENVLAGEVWLCSGQSNMEFYLNWSATAAQDVPQAANSNIRLYDMKARWRTDAVEWDASVLDSLNHLQYYKDTRWTVCSPETAGNFSAVAYYFGKKLQDSLQVPVGLICNAIGGSPTEAWIDRSTLEYRFPAILRNWMQNDFIKTGCVGVFALNVKQSSINCNAILMSLVICMNRVSVLWNSFRSKALFGIRVSLMPIIGRLMKGCSDCWWKVGARIGGCGTSILFCPIV